MTGKSPPPFTALRAIEAAARHRSYTWAAKELSITHSAVSQSIKRLETDLGTKLFERRGAAMEPSAAALQLAQAYADAAGVLRRSLDDIAQTPPPARLVIAMPADFGRLWFTPRLARLSVLMPDLAVEIRTSRHDGGDSDDSDLSIRLGQPKGRDWAFEAIGEVVLTPLCSPAFAERHRLERPADAIRVPLVAERDLSWAAWLSSAGLDPSIARRSHVFDDGAMMLDAAVRGDGLALSQRIFAHQYLASGALVAPLGHDVGSGEQMYLAWKRESEEAPLIERLIGWVRGEMRMSRRPTSSLEQA